MKPWYLSDALIQKIESSAARKQWCETGAYDHFYELEGELPIHLRDRGRMGALFVSEMLGTDGKNLWLFPVEGHKKILKPKSQVGLLSKTGELFFEGHWETCSEELVLKHEEFFVWLKPLENREKASFSFIQKVQGLSRLLKHKFKTKH